MFFFGLKNYGFMISRYNVRIAFFLWGKVSIAPATLGLKKREQLSTGLLLFLLLNFQKAIMFRQQSLIRSLLSPAGGELNLNTSNINYVQSLPWTKMKRRENFTR